MSLIGRTIGAYRVESKLGQGGMGAVYRGLDLMLERSVAIKALRADIAASPQHVERFRQEAKTLARLHHPHIATLYALLREGDDLYMVMEFVEGETFEDVLHRERRLPPDRALGLFDQALRGIEHAHARGIIHRDVKPANFMVMPSGTVKVMDFGIARLLGSTRMTQTRHAIGTAEYMAPEQVRAREVDARTDVYALGILLYELVTGRVPFEAASSFETMQAHLTAAPPSPRVLTADLPEPIEAAILKALAKAPEDRHASVAAFRAALADLPPSAPVSQWNSARPAPPTVAATLPLELPRQPLGPAPETTTASSPDASGGEPTDEEHTEPALPPDDVAATKPGHDARATEEPEDPNELAASSPTPDRSAPGATTLFPTSPASPPHPTVAGSTVTPRAGDDDSPTVPARATIASVRPAPATTIAPAVAQADAEPEDEEVSLTRALQTLPRAALLAAAATFVIALGAWLLRPSTPVPPAEVDPQAERAAEEPSNVGLLGDRAQTPPGAAPLGPPPSFAPAASGDGSPPPVTSPPDAPRPADPRQPDARPEPRQPEPRQPETRRPAPERTPERRPSPEPRFAEPARPATPTTGTARVLVRPFGDVFVDGRRLARETNAPVTADLAPGTYTVRATHPVFGELTETVRVRAGETSEVRLQFATPVDVTVTSTPINAEILLDGRPTGRYTPAMISVPPGTHTIAAERDGYATASRSITVAPGQAPARIALTLTQR